MRIYYGYDIIMRLMFKQAGMTQIHTNHYLHKGDNVSKTAQMWDLSDWSSVSGEAPNKMSGLHVTANTLQDDLSGIWRVWPWVYN